MVDFDMLQPDDRPEFPDPAPLGEAQDTQPIPDEAITAPDGWVETPRDPVEAAEDIGRVAITEPGPQVAETADTPVNGRQKIEQDLFARPEWRLLRGEGVAATPGAAETDPDVEVKRTRMSITCALDAYYGNMSKFSYLTPEQRDALHKETRAIGDEEALGVYVYGLLTHDIGKNQEVPAAVGAGPEVDHDAVYASLINDPEHVEARQRLMPGYDALPEWGKKLLGDMAKAELNYPQILQGEAPAATLEGMQGIEDPRVLQWDILKAKYDIFGAAGHVTEEVSLTATVATYRRMRNLDAALTDPALQTAEERNNAFLDREIADLTFIEPDSLGTSDLRAELRALARLECHLRVDNQMSFDRLWTDFDNLPAVAKEVLVSELNRTSRPTLAYYSPALVRNVADREGSQFALEYLAHVLQEAHIADQDARRTGQPGIATVQLDGLIRSITNGTFRPREQAMRFEPRDGAMVAVPAGPKLESVSDLPAFSGGVSLLDARILIVGEGGGSDGVQAAMVGKLMAQRYGCEVAGVVSIRNQDRVVTGTGTQIGNNMRQITPATEPVGNWRFLEKIPTEGDNPSPMYILNASEPGAISSDINELIGATGATVVIGVDTGGDSLYRSEHPSFSAHLPTDVTPDHDYNSVQALAQVADQRPDVQVISAIVAPGVDSPDYAHDVLEAVGASRLPLTDDDKTLIQRTYAEWRMDGSGSEEGRYGKTPLAWLHALQGRTGFQQLNLPRANVVSETNPWRAFTTITPAMAEVLLMDMRRHAQAIRRD